MMTPKIWKAEQHRKQTEKHAYMQTPTEKSSQAVSALFFFIIVADIDLYVCLIACVISTSLFIYFSTTQLSANLWGTDLLEEKRQRIFCIKVQWMAWLQELRLIWILDVEKKKNM